MTRRKQKCFFIRKILSNWQILFSSFSCPPWKTKPTEYSWNRVVRTVGYKINLKLYLFNEHKNLITTCHFSKKEGTLDIGMKPFWLKYSDGLNQNLNPTFELNPTERLGFWMQTKGKWETEKEKIHLFAKIKPEALTEL